MKIPEGFVLVPVEPTETMKMAGRATLLIGDWNSVIDAAKKVYSEMVKEASGQELPAYAEAAELAACRAHWEKNPNCLFSDMWLGWKACAQSRDGSVSDE